MATISGARLFGTAGVPCRLGCLVAAIRCWVCCVSLTRRGARVGLGSGEGLAACDHRRGPHQR